MSSKPETTVAAIIADQDDTDNTIKVLLTLRAVEPFEGYWCLPGGHIDADESPAEAIRREVQEEVGLDFHAHFFGSFIEVIPKYDVDAVVKVFEGHGEGEVRVESGEVKAVKWITLEEARAMRLAFRHNEILDVYADPTQRREELLREHDSLRSEVLQRLNTRHQSLNLAITATGILIAAIAGGFVPPVALMFYPLLAFCITIAWAQNDIRVGQIGDHIKEIEQLLAGINWEHCLRARVARAPSSIYRYVTEATAIGVFVGTGILTIVLAILFQLILGPQSKPYLSTEVILGLYIVLGIADVLAMFGTAYLVFLRREEYRGGGEPTPQEPSKT